MYVIKVFDNEKFEGYFCGTYTVNDGTFIGATLFDLSNADRIQSFNSLDRAAGRVKSLIEVKLHNGYLSKYSFKVVELSEDEEAKIKKSKKAAKEDKVKKEVVYTGVSKEYLEQARNLYVKSLKRFNEGEKSYYYFLGKVEVLNDILADINNRGDE